jgi:hypothetical protein
MTPVAAERRPMVQTLGQTKRLKANTVSKTDGVLLTAGYLSLYDTVPGLK